MGKYALLTNHRVMFDCDGSGRSANIFLFVIIYIRSFKKKRGPINGTTHIVIHRQEIRGPNGENKGRKMHHHVLFTHNFHAIKVSVIRCHFEEAQDHDVPPFYASHNIDLTTAIFLFVRCFF